MGHLNHWLHTHADQLDQSSELAETVLPALAGDQLLAIGVPQEHGGAGGDVRDAIDAIANVAEQSVTAAFVFWGQRCFIEFLLQSENRALAERRLPGLLAGTQAGASGLSNAMKFLSGIEQLQITGVRHNDGLLVDGGLAWVTNLRKAGFVAAAAVAPNDGAPPAIVAFDSGTPGVQRSDDLDLIALRGSLAPEGAILKRAAATEALLEHEGRAVVFSSLEELAAFLEEQMGRPADMEFTYDTKDGKLTVLQLRPLAAYEEMAKVRIPADWADRTLLRGNRMVSNGRMEHVEHLVYVDPFVYGKDTTFYEVAREIGRINERLEGTNYILVGPGRWGSTNPKLGVPVRYNEICHCGCLIEVGITASDYMPELSYGTHFFSDLAVDNVLYMPVFEGEGKSIFSRDWFDHTKWEPGPEPALRVYHGHFSAYLDGDKNEGYIVERPE